VAASSFTSSAFAQDPPPFTVTGLIANGSGGPSGTVDALASSGDGTQALTILFSDFNSVGRAATGGRAMGTTETCNIAINLQPLQGFQVSLINIETRGFADVLGPQNTSRGINNAVRVSREYFFNDANSNGYRFPLLDTYIVNTSAGYTIQEDTIGLATFSDCNARIIARARMMLTTTGANNTGSIDSVDQNSQLKFNFRTRRCSSNDPKGNSVIIDVDGLDDRAKVKNACVLRGVRNNTGGREICYDEQGDIL
jgi:hypothetical protein